MRAQEMYRRATPPADGGTFFQKQSVPPTPPKNNFKSNSDHFDFAAMNKKDSTKKTNFQASLAGLLDGDMKLIIAMMLLLWGDGGDMLLLMALMYIML